MEKIRVNEAVIVEGKYDKNTLSQIIDGLIVEINGFEIYKDKDKQKYISRLAAEFGIVILTDSDRSGFKLRNFIKSIVKPELVKNAYIPDIYGKERRKRKASSEGKIGVEGMTKEVIIKALSDSGCLIEKSNNLYESQITKADFYSAGLSGKFNSSLIRREFLKSLNLPENMSANELLDYLNRTETKSSFLNRMYEKK